MVPLKAYKKIRFFFSKTKNTVVRYNFLYFIETVITYVCSYFRLYGKIIVTVSRSMLK